jgi:hypothetical protein
MKIVYSGKEYKVVQEYLSINGKYKEFAIQLDRHTIRMVKESECKIIKKEL